MSNVDLHPEDLLDKEILGELSDEERTRLEAHVAVCKACRFERMAREDFRLELDAEVEMARGDAAKLVPLERVERPVLQAPTRRAPFRGRVALLMAAALLLMSAVAGAGWVSIRTITGKGQPERTPTPIETASEAPPRLPVGVGIRPALPAPMESAESPSPESEPSAAVPEPAPVAAAPMSPAPRTPVAPGLSPDSVVDEPEPDAPHGALPIVPDPVPVRTAPSMFADANAARSSGDYGRAIRLYTELQSRFPASAEARTTQAILGRLLLDRGDAAGALRQYDAYLSGGGGLREEAIVGRATALRRLGRTGEEAAAWSMLLTSYPSSAHAENARKRLAQLGGP